MELDNRLLRNSLSKAGKYYVIELQRALITYKKVASGNLKNSIDYSVISTKDGGRLIITAASYLNVIDKGRRKGAAPPPFKSILKWVQIKNINFQKNGKKYTKEQTAYCIKYGISKNGIKPTHILDYTMNKFLNNSVIMNQIKDGVKDVMKQMIQDSLENIRTIKNT